jgi:hypothetical protein
MRYEDLKVGTEVRCVDGCGWLGFATGGIYTVADLWEGGVTLSGGYPSDAVSSAFFDDFEVVVEVV